MNLNTVTNNMTNHFLFSDMVKAYPNTPEPSIRRWINTLVTRNKIVRLRRATGNRTAIYAKV